MFGTGSNFARAYQGLRKRDLIVMVPAGKKH